jgi:hypothetical protein
LKYISIDASGNVTIKGGNIKILSSGNIDTESSGGGNITTKSSGAISLQSIQSINITNASAAIGVQSSGAAFIKGGTVTICCPAR